MYDIYVTTAEWLLYHRFSENPHGTRLRVPVPRLRSAPDLELLSFEASH
ncbi:MAG: hypothetical protein MUF54_25355 [Polyangiaceae bacterium]|nr:hypothetical protein [Polyangiaceae bacterium]